MATLKIEGVPPHDGEYDLDIARLKGSDLHLIKEISGVRVNELQEALEAGDYDLVVAMAVIVLRRAGRTVEPAEIMEAEIGALTVDFGDDAVEEERPLASTPTPNGQPNSTDVGPNADTKFEPSGPTSSDTGDEPANPLRAIGNPG